MGSGEHASRALWELQSRNGALASARYIFLYIITSADFVAMCIKSSIYLSKLGSGGHCPEGVRVVYGKKGAFAPALCIFLHVVFDGLNQPVQASLFFPNKRLGFLEDDLWVWGQLLDLSGIPGGWLGQPEARGPCLSDLQPLHWNFVSSGKKWNPWSMPHRLFRGYF